MLSSVSQLVTKVDSAESTRRRALESSDAGAAWTGVWQEWAVICNEDSWSKF